MAGDKHETEQIVADVIVDRGVEVGYGLLLPRLQLVAELLVLPVEQGPAAKLVDGPVLRGGHEPGARIVGDTRFGPALEGRDQGILREVLGEADIAHDPCEAGDQPRGFDSPDGVDRPVGAGLRHGDQSHQLHLRAGKGSAQGAEEEA